MSKETIQKRLLAVCVLLLLISFSITAWGLIKELLNPGILSEKAKDTWEIIKWGWVMVFGEVVAFFFALAKNVFGLRNDDLAQAIANLWAQKVVEEANSDPTALNTGYIDTKNHLRLIYRRQGDGWLSVLLKEFQAETEIEAKRYLQLRAWRPPTTP